MSKIKRFTRFIAVLLLTALSFGPAMAGTGGYGRRNINTTINQRVTPVFNFNSFSATATNIADPWSNTLTWGYEATDLQNAVNQLESLYSKTGVITASEFSTYLSPQDLQYLNNSNSPPQESLTVTTYPCVVPTEDQYPGGYLPSNCAHSVNVNGYFGGMLNAIDSNVSNGTSNNTPWGRGYIQTITPSENSTSYNFSGKFTVNSKNQAALSLSGHSLVHSAVTVKTSGIIAAKNQYTLQTNFVASPLVLNMSGNGKLEASGGQWLPHPDHLYANNLVLFDFLGDGFPVIMEWVGPSDGILVDPTLGNCSMTHVNGTCMFGTVGGFANGYQKLSLLNKNHTGTLTGNELKGLYVWQDKNDNAKVDPGELKSVQSLGITAIHITKNPDMKSWFIRNGEKYAMWDWYPNVMEVIKNKP